MIKPIPALVKTAIQKVMDNTGYLPEEQLAEILQLLDISWHYPLGCDYAEHVLWVYEKIYGDVSTYIQALNVARSFVVGKSSVDEVILTYEGLLTESLDGISEYKFNVAAEAATTITWALKLCCHEPLEELNYTPRYPLAQGALIVAQAASYAVGVYEGGEHYWDHDHPQLETEARQHGLEAEQLETKWQLDHVSRLIDLYSA